MRCGVVVVGWWLGVGWTTARVCGMSLCFAACGESGKKNETNDQKHDYFPKTAPSVARVAISNRCSIGICVIGVLVLMGVLVLFSDICQIQIVLQTTRSDQNFWVV